MKRFMAMFFYFFAVVNLHAQSLEAKMDSIVSDYARKTNFNGAVLVAQKGKVIVDAQIEFEQDANGKIKSLTLHQNGMKMRGDKVE